MAGIDRNSDLGRSGTEHERARSAPRWLSETTTWFAVAAIGMATVFVGLAVDAWKHNNGGGEEQLLSFTNPGHAIAGAGLVITTLAVLAGFTLSQLRGVETAQTAIRRFVPVLGAFVLISITGVGSLTYIGATGATVGANHGHDDALVAADHPHPDGTSAGDAGVAQALKDKGLLDGESEVAVNPSKVEGALTQGSNGEANGGDHDHGQQPTFTQVETMSDDELLPLFPEGKVTKADLPAMREQIKQARAVALELDTPEKAMAAGYSNTTSDVPFMGQHYLNFDRVRDGKFNAAEPEGLLFSKIDDGPEKLVGVWYLQLPGIGGVTRDVEPVGFASDLDLWHAHVGLCIVGFDSASEGETKESCQAKGGSFNPDLRWMMHLWVTPETTENPAGVMSYLNNDLYEKQQAAKESEAAPSGVTP